jgi:hypothetical protein
MSNILIPKSQAEMLADKLKEIRQDVTSNDRLHLENALAISKSTISKYLSGNVYDNDTAVAILECLRKKISERSKIINNA